MSDDPGSSKVLPTLTEIPRDELQFVEPVAGIATIYANAAQVVITAEDASIIFSVRDPNDPSLTHVQARVYMPLSHSKRLLVALANGIKSLESYVGEIDMDPTQKLKQAAEQAESDKELGTHGS